MKAQLVHVDAFTGAPFKGNPAMVCILPAERSCSPSSEWCQALAADINLSETVFLRPLGSESSSDYQIRWFTPFAEVDLCGHATLAAAHAVFESHGTEKKMSSLSFDSASGVLTIERAGDMLWMNFPRIHTVGVPESAELHNTVAAALGILAGEISFLGRTTSDVLFVVVQSEEAVRSLSPDFRLMSALPRHHGVLATSEADVKTKADFVSRYFAPTLGIDEDPVTGMLGARGLIGTLLVRIRQVIFLET